VGVRLNHTLVEHWNGSRWVRVSAPSPAPRFSVLTDVAAGSATDVWAVGRDGANGHTLALHWDGHSWKHVPTPDGGRQNNELTSVAVLSPTNAWASGDWGAAGHPLIEHWNGTKWRLAHVPRTPAGSILISISAASASDIWSVGTQFPLNNGSTFPPVGMHWNGSGWRASPPPGVNGSGFYEDVIARTHTDVWAVGGTRRALAAHWNGTRWQLGAPKTPGESSYLASVDSVPTTTQVWAAGGTIPAASSPGQILIERHC
jgi:hypothetical protein